MVIVFMSKVLTFYFSLYTNQIIKEEINSLNIIYQFPLVDCEDNFYQH